MIPNDSTEDDLPGFMIHPEQQTPVQSQQRGVRESITLVQAMFSADLNLYSWLMPQNRGKALSYGHLQSLLFLFLFFPAFSYIKSQSKNNTLYIWNYAQHKLCIPP